MIISISGLLSLIHVFLNIVDLVIRIRKKVVPVITACVRLLYHFVLRDCGARAILLRGNLKLCHLRFKVLILQHLELAWIVSEPFIFLLSLCFELSALFADFIRFAGTRRDYLEIFLLFFFSLAGALVEKLLFSNDPSTLLSNWFILLT